MRLISFGILFFGITFCFSQNKINNNEKCKTYISNLSLEKSYFKEICYFVKIIDHNDLNQFRLGEKWNKDYDFWKFLVVIIDIQKKTQQKFEGSFYIYEENNEIKQFHSNLENNEIKAIIYDKTKKVWEILLFQNNEYKILSPNNEYKLINAFNIKKNKNSGISY